jgi:hypothetical protein
MLCKTAVARKVLTHAWKNRLSLGGAEIHRIDALRHFGAAVNACVLVCDFAPAGSNYDCLVYGHPDGKEPPHIIGYREGHLVADADMYEKWKHLQGGGTHRWRSGIKHDCHKVMEFVKEGNAYRNGLGELVELEDDCLYPVLKSSDLANGRVKSPTRWMLVPQRRVSEGTAKIRSLAPKTWKYLLQHGEMLDGRASSIYQGRPRFSVFGVGDYSFARWKVAVSGLYKKLNFTQIGSFAGKPIVLDDTSYFLPCRTKQEAELIANLLNSEISKEFFSGFIFWDAKRPITVEVLQRLNIPALAQEVGVDNLSPLGECQSRLFRYRAEARCAQVSQSRTCT